MEILKIIVVILLGYLVGSIPFALIVGKVFYNKDIRKEGSGNLGGTNAGRTLGRKAGLAVTLLDIAKSFVVICIASFLIKQFDINLNPNFAGLACVIGHCYPIFANFKGGKGVACSAGFILAINPILLFIAVAIFVINLKIHKMVSLASMVAVSSVTVLSFCFTRFENTQQVLLVLSFFLIFQHRENIHRIKHNTENKVTWI